MKIQNNLLSSIGSDPILALLNKESAERSKETSPLPVRMRDDSPVIGGAKRAAIPPKKLAPPLPIGVQAGVPRRCGFGLRAPKTDLIDQILLNDDADDINARGEQQPLQRQAVPPRGARLPRSPRQSPRPNSKSPQMKSPKLERPMSSPSKHLGALQPKRRPIKNTFFAGSHASEISNPNSSSSGGEEAEDASANPFSKHMRVNKSPVPPPNARQHYIGDKGGESDEAISGAKGTGKFGKLC